MTFCLNVWKQRTSIDRESKWRITFFQNNKKELSMDNIRQLKFLEENKYLRKNLHCRSYFRMLRFIKNLAASTRDTLLD
jgi:hypothetical protein